MDKRRVPVLCDNKTCTGCGSCSNSCPVDAISMDPHAIEGFYRPVIDDEKCIRCLKCERMCPVITPLPSSKESDTVYAAWNRNPRQREDSSSGGAFAALAMSVLRRNGIVIGAAYGEKLHLEHIAIDGLDGLEKLQASKYFQSETGFMFRKAVEYAKDGRYVLFCGTPCQVAGLRSYMGTAHYPTLFLIDFICHGVPSPKFFHVFVEWLSDRYGQITNFSFRDKRNGWYDAVRVVRTDSAHVLRGKYDSYWIGFNENLSLQEACYNCKFLGTRRNSDLTIGDFWGIGKIIPFGNKSEIEKGVSMIMINTPKGDDLFSLSKESMEIFPRSMDEVITGNHALIASSSRPLKRDTFYKDLSDMTFDGFRRKYLVPGVKTSLVKIMREYMPRFITEYIRVRDQK